ncbi:cysteine hydrolase family protein [Oharaeibacter diazotrophicus]|uniref:Nicotinamidase-related amidase n=1 Tax=Oharaeibacter diazotrophicus TaxID=1920512 RepID=A0A4R6RM29_9HYPH|nr:cysteine hydrolase family protein [Oharaeibacter diazotrophicus]TDP87195.1 nicotinamidase-related amidase [Oharaeibacter diazotrophicus]BBE70862.1 isochorismatase family protein YecD [Pleomorphomonas sp. SM30]GLS77611.1 amidase [Oharaeibacter diazotrophicus]
MTWKTRYRSFYYDGAPEPEDPVLLPGKVALLVIDVQNVYLDRPDPETLSGADLARWHAWTPFHRRMHETVLPTIARLEERFRAGGLDVLFARIACHLSDGRDRSLSQKKPGWNDLKLPKGLDPSQIPAAVGPVGEEIVVTKTTDSALTGTNLRLILANMGITHVVCAGIFTDQCVSSTVRSLADESFDVIVVDDACAAGTMDLHERELEIMNMIYCSVMTADELIGYLPPA